MRKIKMFLILIITAFIFFGGIYVLLLWPSNPIITKENVDSGPKFFSILDGMPVADQSAIMPQVVAVMIDNFPSARPQSGLAQAKIIYEVPVEGALTRFMAIFDRSTLVDKVGPVRSARPYFLDWQAEYGKPLYMHSGGSPEALKEIKNSDIFDANEFYFGAYYWRDKNRAAPHNLFTSSVLWNKLAERFPAASSTWTGRQFSQSVASSSTPAYSILIKYATNYRVGWKYDSARGIYERDLNGTIYGDDSGEVLTADNIIIQYVKMRSLDEEDRKEIVTIGSGSARVLRDGRLIYGQWKKDTAASRTVFSDLNGEEIKFKPGVTWIQIVPFDITVEVGS